MSTIFLGRDSQGEAQELLLSRANRHGLIAGATGTGKTVTLQGLAESFSAAGVPVFVADVKGDLAGLAVPGSSRFKHADKLEARAAELGMDDYAYADFPVIFWDLFGQQGHPVRTTISEMGPLLLARLLDLNDTQEGVLQIVFRYADDNGLLLLDFADLRSLLAHAADNTDAVGGEYGRISKASIGAIQRRLLSFESEGADRFFGEPALEVDDLFRIDASGRGFINILAADRLMGSPKLYATYLFWLLAELFETLPEVGDQDKPKLVFFFDEAHLLFKDASKDFLDQVTRVVRLIRSKGVGIFFVTQTPKDVPSDVLAQLGSRVQHQLRAHTPDDAKALRATVSTYPNSGYELDEVLTNLATGEAIVTVMNEKGAPSPVAWTRLRAPQGSMSPTDPAVIAAAVDASPLTAKYGVAIDPSSAREKLTMKAAEAEQARTAEAEATATAAALERQLAAEQKAVEKRMKAAQREAEKRAKAAERAEAKRAREQAARDERRLKQTVNAGVKVARVLVNTIFGSTRKR